MNKTLAMAVLALAFLAVVPANAATSATLVSIRAGAEVEAHCPTTSITVNVFDGSRKLVPDGTEVLVRLFDGKHSLLSDGFFKGPVIRFEGVPLCDSDDDSFTVVVSRARYHDGGISSVRMHKAHVAVHTSTAQAQTVDLMLVPAHAFVDFAEASARQLQTRNPEIWHVIAAGTDNAGSGVRQSAEAVARWNDLIASRPLSAMCLLNILTALSQAHFRDGRSPIAFYKELIWDKSMAQDRFFAWVDEQYIHELEAAATDGSWQEQPAPGILHPGATRAWKQTELEEANLNPTAHENDVRIVDGKTYVLMETDIDFYKDKLAHVFLEVIPNLVRGGLTDPRLVYQLRWNAGASAGLPEFTPPFVVVPASADYPEAKRSHEHRDLKNILRWPGRAVRRAIGGGAVSKSLPAIK